LLQSLVVAGNIFAGLAGDCLYGPAQQQADMACMLWSLFATNSRLKRT
jgi:hypothetical protein